MEYEYSRCAMQCGIIMSETRLFPSERCKGYFGTKRFDRRLDKTGCKKIHMLTAAALLELDFEQPSLDYHSLTKSSKSPASIAKSNKQWVGTCLYQKGYKPLLINCEAVIWL